MGRLGARYAPSLEVSVLIVRFVAVWTTFTWAPGTSAPELSVTVPEIAPSRSWADSRADATVKARARTQNCSANVIFFIKQILESLGSHIRIDLTRGILDIGRMLRIVITVMLAAAAAAQTQ